MPALMVQGTASGVGKTTLVAALCRIFRRRGLRVAPFKAQNMANNAHVCADGSEIGRSTALQALACGLEPRVEMNPILLKPTSDVRSQVVLMGRPTRTLTAAEYLAERPRLLGLVRSCLESLQRDHDLVILEGAGSPAEVNLRDGDLVNMAAAEIACAPVLLAANIDVGGVFAQLVGTLHLLPPADRARVKGLVVNKFRGDLSLFRPGVDFLEHGTGLPVLGVVPFDRSLRLPEEDELPARRDAGPRRDRVRVDVVLHPRMANFTDLDALEAEEDVELRWCEAPDGTVPDAYLLPGTKSTIADLRRLKAAGWEPALRRALERGAVVAGVCGGYQMMGLRVEDPDGVEAAAGDAEGGLGLLPVRTRFSPEKRTALVRGVHLDSGAEVEGYEIHLGRTESEGAEPALRITERGGAACRDFDGARATGGRAWGTYVHGLFDRPGFRRAFVDGLRAARGWRPLGSVAAWNPDRALDRLADHVEASLDIERISDIAGLTAGKERTP